ncbi:cyanidin 3-O-galactoside 2''-O-xylosyltransferase FGGT1-like [Humulus lupulus]|uniref:cyanidin 3-O-galactoside 2''-O-xylosyltransferase FGGT1-like n=1 Tax=Humulus lupulus TaxID=3486 RepID=UPI002B412C98|nr:cyanidin 3-O-galactoside 2''-O-xylosyltransferase FGGT1-like [Humulus lupulus]
MEGSTTPLHIAMYPWFAFGHITPYLHLANKLAQKGHKISFFIPTKTQSKINHLNRSPHLLTFYPITVPHVDGLPSGAETTNDVPSSLIPLIMTAMDSTQNDIELLLLHLKPHLVFYDLVYWIPNLTRRLGLKSLHFSVVSAVSTAFSSAPAKYLSLKGRELSESDIMKPPPGFPDSSINLHLHEARGSLKRRDMKFGGDVVFCDRWFMSLTECDALGFKACRELDGPFVDYLETEFGKPLLLSGPLIPEPSISSLDPKWVDFLGGFKPGSVIYCAFGSEVILEKDQFQELLLGLELSGHPFLAALRPPSGADSLAIEEALPDGFEERVGGRGVVHGGWIQQPQILEHPSVGCSVTHCGSGTIFEILVNQCQIVMIPNCGDQILNARLMGNNLKVGVEVEKGEEDGLFTKESVCKAISTVMEQGNEVGKEVRSNRAKLRELLLSKDMESSYIDDFIHKLQALVLR